jgi:putative iron-dependent peroxidase
VTVTTPTPSNPDAEPQAVLSPLTGAAIFLVVVAGEDAASLAAVRDICGDIPALVRTVGFRAGDAYLTCVTGIGDRLWDRLAGGPQPAELHPFREIDSGGRHAVATPGDLLFHIRASRMDLCFELASLVVHRLGDAATVADEVHGFRYFDSRDLLGFVDGTENPTGPAAERAALIGAEDPAYAGGSYVIVQKYLHDLDGWNALPTEQQENIIGRYKLNDVEQDDDVKPTSAHNALTTIEGPDGTEIQILRDNMPFGSVSAGEYGTYFIGYARSPGTTELMLRNMFIGSPPGNYDRILDFSTAVTGGLFFVPPEPMLESLADGPLAGQEAAPQQSPAPPDTASPQSTSSQSGSLQIGSLKGASRHE